MKFVEKATCENCKFCRRDGNVERCHRNPPMFGSNGQWPLVTKTDWCGEHKMVDYHK